MNDNGHLSFLAAAAAVLAATAASAQESGGMPPLDAMPPQARLAYNLGSAGLLGRMNTYENFNTVQARIALSRAQIEFSRVSGVTSGYEDDSDVIVLPFDVMYALPGSGGQSFLRFNGFVNDVGGAGGNPTQLKSSVKRLDVQYMRSPDIDTLWGIGLYVEAVDVDLEHTGGTIDRDSWGIRADYVRKFSPRWGVAARADLNFGTAETRVPVAPGVDYELDQDDTRLYLQGDVVGTYTSRDAGWIPAGWVFHPMISAVYQRTEFDPATTSFGQTVEGTVGDSDDYGWVGASARFESMDFRPGRLAPYFEVGLQHEYVNDLDLFVDDPNILHSVVGLSMNIGRGGRLDFEYGRHDGLEGERKDQALTVHVGYVF